MQHRLLLNTSTGRHLLTVDSADLVLSGGKQVEQNRETCALFIASWLALLSDSPVTDSRKPLRLFKRFYKRLCTDLKATVISFADLAHIMVSQCHNMGQSSFAGDWIDDFKETPVFFEYCRWFKDSNPELASFIYTWLSFGKKLDYVDDEFNSTALRGWLDVEQRLSDQVLSDDDTTSLRSIIHKLLPLDSFAALWPKHGPGAVSERGVRGPNRKHDALRYDRILDLVFFKGHIGMYGAGEDLGLSASKVIPDPWNWIPQKESRRTPARLQFVPKSLKVARSICMEPTALMFFQQAVMRRLCDAIESSQFGLFIKLKDQERNQRLALWGSISSEVDTLDLSSASDSLSYKLVKRVFPTRWLIQMAATRSRDVRLPNGRIISIKKFAPMGSALCFPTQCLIFASVCIYASHLYGETLPYDAQVSMSEYDVYRAVRRFSKTPIEYDSTSTQLQPCAIYGDDICCDQRITPYVKSILARLGFTVNDQKSFTASQAFRESCGKYFLAGEDLSPMFFRVKTVRRLLTPEHIASQVHLINEAGTRGFDRLRGFLIHTMREWPVSKKLDRFSVPFVPISSLDFGILSNTPVNSHLESRRNPDYQRTEYRIWSISYDEREKWTYAHDKYSYMRWWASKYATSIPDQEWPGGHASTAGSRIKWRWTPLY
ncbi:RNA-directed RNA polymerase [ssRNA phage Esthiorhiza.2_43]|uniref:RNA-directed RNA polymerase n=2 Tax=Leviviricetes TaxID=2842243 RepID=A0A8S5L2B6_9VIRU|nr:RNA-directed RNA polymerase [ssRNA phage Esthiorhiza.2_43]QDH91254.1 MAG: RNA-dependent RNA polymerase [Leviviridae sp.]DAD51635.1 TPA_asm: RNA-directed RNA polymerase [ssRNA phage Esthiorhiza.2_43]